LDRGVDVAQEAATVAIPHEDTVPVVEVCVSKKPKINRRKSKDGKKQTLTITLTLTLTLTWVLGGRSAEQADEVEGVHER
jgi:hypothetical protein